MIFSIHLLCSLYMFGLIWFVQVVHYPLFAKVKPENFVEYERSHTAKTSWVTAIPMLIELITAICLLWEPPTASNFWYFNLGGVLLLWASTFFIQVPLHQRLSKKYSQHDIRSLVLTNWIRTAIWSIRAVALITII